MEVACGVDGNAEDEQAGVTSCWVGAIRDFEQSNERLGDDVGHVLGARASPRREGGDPIHVSLVEGLERTQVVRKVHEKVGVRPLLDVAHALYTRHGPRV